jgi:hypothetical protein
MKRKSPTTEEKLTSAAHRALSGENLEGSPMGNAAKPLSLHPLKFEAAVSSLLKVKPPAKPETAEE